MTTQRDILGGSHENPKKAQFYRDGNELRVTIRLDRSTTVDRVATEEDKATYSHLLPKRGRPRKQ